MFLVMLSSLSRFVLVIRFARDDDQRDEAMSWVGRWQTPIAILPGYRRRGLQGARVNSAEPILGRRMRRAFVRILGQSPQALRRVAVAERAEPVRMPES
jgi:hypothetical protein